MEFEQFPKLSRLSREAIITEKIDGTNAQIYIVPAREVPVSGNPYVVVCGDPGIEGSVTIFAGSRNRWITPENDNFGFARWVREHGEELRALGPGRHFGEWWGNGIQRGYGLKEKRFSLFNVQRWCLPGNQPLQIKQANPTAPPKYQEILPTCVGLVPVLSQCSFNTLDCDSALESLRLYGSQAVPGYMNPEGIVVWHVAANKGFKKTLGGDGHKGA